MLIRDLFKKQVKKTPDAAALIYKEKETHWREIDSLSNRFAQGILNLGFRKGDRLAGILNSPVEFIVPIVSFELVHSTVEVISTVLRSERVPMAWNCCEPPAATAEFSGEISTYIIAYVRFTGSRTVV